MKRILLSILLFVPLLTYSQGFNKTEIKRLEKVLKRSNSQIRNFNDLSLISIDRVGNDEIEGLVENALFTAGFEVVSNKMAKDAINISNPLNSENKDLEVSRSLEFKSVYVVSVSGQYFDGPLIGKCQRALLTFSARIVDLANDGKLVGTFRYSGNALTYVACEEDVANAFAYELSKLSK